MGRYGPIQNKEQWASIRKEGCEEREIVRHVSFGSDVWSCSVYMGRLLGSPSNPVTAYAWMQTANMRLSDRAIGLGLVSKEVL